MYPAHLVFTATHLIKLREQRVGFDEAVFLARRPLRTITKITAKKKHPTLITLAYDDDGTHEDVSSMFGSAVAVEENEVAGVKKKSITERFMIPQAEEAKEALKNLVSASRVQNQTN